MHYRSAGNAPYSGRTLCLCLAQTLRAEEVNPVHMENQMQLTSAKLVFPLLLLAAGILYVVNESEQDTQDAFLEPSSSFSPVTAINDGGVEVVKYDRKPGFRFGGYPCIEDCSEHMAGYSWAEDNGISEPDNCDGLSAEFMEGCRVFAESRIVALTVATVVISDTASR